MSKAENARYYNEGGVLLPSVNTVLGILDKPWKMWWIKSLISKHGDKAWEKMQEAGDRAKQIGTDLHTYINRMFCGYKGEDYSEGFSGPEIERCMDNFCEFSRQFNPTCYFSEKVVTKNGTNNVKYAGTLDWYGKVTDEKVEKWVLIDWKTSKDVSQEEYAIQIEAYHRAMPQECPVDELWIVGLDKVKKFDKERDIKKYKPSRRRYVAFLHLLALFQYFNPNPNPQPSSVVKVPKRKRVKK